MSKNPLLARHNYATLKFSALIDWKESSECFIYFTIESFVYDIGSVTRKKSPNVYKSCPKMISLEIWSIFTPLEKLPKMWKIWAN